VIGEPGTTRLDTLAKFLRDCSSVQAAAPSESGSSLRRVPTLPPWQVMQRTSPSREASRMGCTFVRKVSKSSGCEELAAGAAPCARAGTAGDIRSRERTPTRSLRIPGASFVRAPQCSAGWRLQLIDDCRLAIGRFIGRLAIGDWRLAIG